MRLLETLAMMDHEVALFRAFGESRFLSARAVHSRCQVSGLVVSGYVGSRFPSLAISRQE